MKNAVVGKIKLKAILKNGDKEYVSKMEGQIKDYESKVVYPKDIKFE